MTLQTSRAICGTNRDRTALMYSTFRAEKQKQCPKKSGDAGEGIGNYVSPNRVLRRNRVRTLPEPERDERNSNVSPTRAPRRNRVRTLPEPERDERDQRNLCGHSSRFCRLRSLLRPSRFRSRRGASTRSRPLRGRGGPATDRAFSQPPQSKDKAHRKNSKELSTESDFNDFTGVSDKFF